MVSKAQWNQKIDKIREHFDLKDLLGLSALVFGLLLSNSSLKTHSKSIEVSQPSQAQSIESQETKTEAPKTSAVKKNNREAGTRPKQPI